MATIPSSRHAVLIGEDAARSMWPAAPNRLVEVRAMTNTGASNIAQMASNREELMRVVNMMGDTNVETVRRYYFNFTYDEDDQIIDRWELPKKASARRRAAYAARLRSDELIPPSPSRVLTRTGRAKPHRINTRSRANASRRMLAIESANERAPETRLANEASPESQNAAK